MIRLLKTERSMRGNFSAWAWMIRGSELDSGFHVGSRSKFMVMAAYFSFFFCFD